MYDTHYLSEKKGHILKPMWKAEVHQGWYSIEKSLNLHNAL